MSHPINIKETGKRIKRARINQHYSTKEFSNKIFYSESLIHRWERGEMIPTTTSLAFISHFTKTKIDDLLVTEWDDDKSTLLKNKIFIPTFFKNKKKAKKEKLSPYQEAFHSYLDSIIANKPGVLIIGIENGTTLISIYSDRTGNKNTIWSNFDSKIDLYTFIDFYISQFKTHITFKRLILVADNVKNGKIEFSRIEIRRKNGQVYFDDIPQKEENLFHIKKKTNLENI